MSDHTKGPWEAVNTSVRQIASGCIVAKAVEDTASDAVTSREQALANAKLIAAAPAMRDALEKCAYALSVISLNARTIPDPRMNGRQDISAVPIEDIEDSHAALAEAVAVLKATGENP